jgi:hypothetical protein
LIISDFRLKMAKENGALLPLRRRKKNLEINAKVIFL